MSELLTELLEAGLIDKLGGDDELFEKFEKAAESVAEEFNDNPALIIRAILAGLNPDVAKDDPAIIMAKKALTAEWKSMSSVHPDTPIKLLRAIILDACDQIAKNTNAAVLWLTAADTLPFTNLGKEAPAVKRLLKIAATKYEEFATQPLPLPHKKKNPTSKLKAPVIPKTPAYSLDKEDLKLRVAAAAGQNYNNQSTGEYPANRYWASQGQDWSWDFTDRMTGLLADEFEGIAEAAIDGQAELNKQIVSSQTAIIDNLKEELASQRRWIKDVIDTTEKRTKAEQLRLNTLWWYETLYSTSLQTSYRQLPIEIASVAMAIDILEQLTTPTPASVGYVLAEAVNRLPGADFDEKISIQELLKTIHEKRNELPSDWREDIFDAPENGCLSLRDAIAIALKKNKLDIDATIERTAYGNEDEISLPEFAHALFRQEQAEHISRR
ncbi:hypothetical protein GO013_00025 [Pseudodesulfovibrio sp. JC047]|uniref:GTPase-associated system all-helical protein GASH n=1 Tax=Pseudodesulfovibrio sp. JC047 TaxID=2683199 RepID=UPI0013D6269F|nr:GTPase-associated system all-helical protein GASH [Pseudodesulfovibrio sp. JC047]NDV17804.1 hypothetical protein [Pseudodesulfovibrio sp. JC047]